MILHRRVDGHTCSGKRRFACALIVAALCSLGSTRLCAQLRSAAPQTVPYELNDSHFHLTNYIQEGTDLHDFLKIMGTKVGRVALFGIPLQQEWSYLNSGTFAPTYYLQTDAPLYYYSFTHAYIAMAYRSLSKGTTGALRSHDHRVQSG
jgi:hypothetical protein